MSSATATIFKVYDAFFQKFNAIPSFAVVRIGLDAIKGLSEHESKAAQEALSTIEAEPMLDESQQPWLLESAEKWCQDQALYSALRQSVKLMDDPKASPHAIPDLLKDALAVTFDTHIGHDYYGDSQERYDFYHMPTTKLPFHLDTFNKMTGGGVPRKTLNVILAGTNVGKSLTLCDFTAAYLQSNLNVLYITCEMGAEWIAHRIDANLFDIPMDDVILLPAKDYSRKIANLRQTSTGRLIIKEYPPAVAHVGIFRALLQELRLKENFVPDVIMVDYLTICASNRVKLDAAANSFSYHKFIAEELRGLAVEFDVPLWTAGQFNRTGFASSKPGLEHVGESFGIPQTADFCVALIQTEELEKVGQIEIHELKNRYARKKSYEHHLLGMDTTRMKLYELSAAAHAASLSLPANAPTATGASAFSKPRGRTPLKTLRTENINNANGT